MEQIKKALEAYLEEKRKNFPRFYFLSNPDLLSLLSNQSDPKKVEIHLNKCFDGIVKLE
jgi:dynein heavy chain